MSAMDEAFGHRADRPDHPDFWRLSQVILKIDGAVEAGQLFEAVVGEVIDPATLTYVAMERAKRMAGTPTQLVNFAATWVDAFVAGVEYQRARDAETGAL